MRQTFTRRWAVTVLPAAVVAALLATTLAGSAARAATPGAASGVVPAAAAPTAVSANVAAVPTAGLTIHGAGYGHGRGMSQYGAQAAAKAGLATLDILRFYYPGTEYYTSWNRPVRTRLSAIDGGYFSFHPTAGTTVTGLVATAADRTVVRLPARTRYQVTRSGDRFLVQEPASATTWRTVRSLAAPVTFSGPATLRVVYSRPKDDCRGGDAVTFAGTLRAVISGGKPYYLAQQPIDSYLRGVVAAEMPASWHPAALRAQAVAARSYATSRTNPTRFYDFVDTQADQCWDGQAAETASTNAAIAATALTVLRHRGTAINAQFSSNSGGWTASGGVSYLPAKADRYSTASGAATNHWTRTLTGAALAAADGAGGLTTVTDVRITGRTGGGRWGGRVTAIQLTGRDAAGKTTTVSVSGSTFRSRLGLRSEYLGFTSS